MIIVHFLYAELVGSGRTICETTSRMELISQAVLCLPKLNELHHFTRAPSLNIGQYADVILKR